jgi:magnesium transporter
MNFDTASPFNMPELEWRFGYPIVLLVMLGISGGLLWWFRRRGWLGAGPRRRPRAKE